MDAAICQIFGAKDFERENSQVFILGLVDRGSGIAYFIYWTWSCDILDRKSFVCAVRAIYRDSSSVAFPTGSEIVRILEYAGGDNPYDCE